MECRYQKIEKKQQKIVNRVMQPNESGCNNWADGQGVFYKEGTVMEGMTL